MLTPQDMKILSGTELMAGCDQNTLEHLRSLWNRKSFPAGAVLMTAEQPGEVIYVIAEGWVRVHVEGYNGNEIIVAILGQGQVLGEISLIDSQRRSATVTVAEPSVLFWTGLTEFRDQVHSSPVLLMNVAKILTQRLRLSTAQIQALNSLDVRGRIATQLLSLAREFGQAQAGGEILIPLHLTQTDLSNMIGATKVSVNQTLANWKKRGIIQILPQSRIAILNVALLNKEIQ